MKITINPQTQPTQKWEVGDVFLDDIGQKPRIIIHDGEHYGLLAFPHMNVMFMDREFNSPTTLMNWYYEVQVSDNTLLQKLKIAEIQLEVN